MTVQNKNYSYLVSGIRTPIGSFMGSLSALTAPELGAYVIRNCAEQLHAQQSVSEVIMGNVLQAGVGQAPARQAALKAGLPHETPCLTINKVCGSGLKAVTLADQAIRSGDAKIVIAGGMESMSNAPHFSHAIRKGVKFGETKLLDAMQFDGLTCAFDHCLMGNHAEHIARKFEVTREQQDHFAFNSQQWAAEAQRQNLFKDETISIEVKDRRESKTVTLDECIRENTSIESLAKLRPAFEENGTVTAGNASCISDGAAAVLVMDEESANAYPTQDKFQILGSFTSGVEPKDLFIAPVTAIEGVLKKTGIDVDAIDFFEINEAFAAQMIACITELRLEGKNVNVNGGGISLGHPIGLSGARCLVTLMHTMKRNSAKIGLVSLCLGGGNAVAMIIKSVD